MTWYHLQILMDKIPDKQELANALPSVKDIKKRIKEKYEIEED